MGVVVLPVVALGLLVQHQFTATAFDRIEADRVLQDAQRIRVALDYETRSLSDYGAAKSIWDSSFTDVRTADPATFEEDFPPRDIRDVFGVDGVVSTGPDGTVRVGGLVGAGTGFEALPAELARPALLKQLFDVGGEAGSARCGVVRTSTIPFLYCGFASYPGNGAGEPAGGLIYFKALDQARVTALGDQVGLPVTLARQTHASGDRSLTLPSRLGDLKVTTDTLDEDRVSVNVSLPAAAGSPVVLETVRDRPVHGTAAETSRAMLVLAAVTAAVLLGAVTMLVRRGIRRQVGALRRTAETVVASGDLTLRVRSGDHGEIGALGGVIDTMLGRIARLDADLERANAAREEQVRLAYAQRQLNEQEARRRAQEVINANVSTIMSELRVVADATAELLGAAGSIDQRVSVTDAISHRVIEQARRASNTTAQLGTSLRKVEGVAHVISSVAAQTHLLALNATTEAVRSGEAGKGFSLVAREVKELATATTQSTDEITAIIRSLEHNAAAMAGALTDMTGGVGDLGAAAAQVTTIIQQQHSNVGLLKEYLERAIHRISTMEDLTKQLERRGAPRVAVSGTTQIRTGGQSHSAQLLDLSVSGTLCSTVHDIPLQPGDLLEIDIPLRGERPLTLRAGVVHCRRSDGITELGLCFTDVSSAAMDRINQYVMAALMEED
ncbi:hypothetical protein GCM10010156_70990 [Planobispora rosea]|uniref:Methyl-accepting chemotaxis protein n=1 Tax=Planobispora rosea TaxID=35762 RepID=A0A8J3WFH1_PLARO|nr:hypothetical protein GCM10010156_70990 [Planobispora rosea]GIH86837.1 hypothetical protein Pro02_52450 [Planobispora rosea]